MNLSDATAVYAGTTEAKALYYGPQLLWNVPGWEPPNFPWADFAGINAGVSIFSTAADTLNFTINTGGQIRLFARPAGNGFRYRSTLNPGIPSSQIQGGWQALAAYNANNGRIVTALYGRDGSVNSYVWIRWNNFSLSYNSEQARLSLGSQETLAIEMEWDGSTLFGRRWDGQNWANAGTEAHAEWLGAPTHFAFAASSKKLWTFSEIKLL